MCVFGPCVRVCGIFMDLQREDILGELRSPQSITGLFKVHLDLCLEIRTGVYGKFMDRQLVVMIRVRGEQKKYQRCS